MSQAEFSKKINASLTTAEKMTKSLSSMTGGMKKILDTVQPGAVKFANVVSNSFGKIQKQTGNSAASVLAFQAGLKGIRETGLAAKEILHDVGETVGAVGARLGKTGKTILAVLGLGTGVTAAAKFGPDVVEGLEGDMTKPPEGEDTTSAKKVIEEREATRRAFEEKALADASPEAMGALLAQAPPVNVTLNLDGEVLDKRTISLLDGKLSLT